jgi:hypothetical protein
MVKTYKDKVTSFEVQPPLVAWDYISEELIANKELLAISNKLFNYEVDPPLNTWSTIITSLKKEDRAIKKFSIIKQKNRFLSYTAAAAIVGIIVVGLLFFNNVNVLKNQLTTSHTFITNYKKAQTEDPIVKSLPLISIPDAEEIMEAPAVTTYKTNKNFTKNNKVLQNTKVKNSLFHGNELQIIIASKPIRNANGIIIQDPEIINNPGSKYISITGPNGQQTKISSKFLHMLLFINDDSDIDEVDGYFDKNFLESLIWKSRFQDWRNEIINTSFVPSSTNFMDILDFKDLIMKDN